MEKKIHWKLVHSVAVAVVARSFGAVDNFLAKAPLDERRNEGTDQRTRSCTGKVKLRRFLLRLHIAKVQVAAKKVQLACSAHSPRSVRGIAAAAAHNFWTLALGVSIRQKKKLLFRDYFDFARKNRDEGKVQ